MRRRLRAARHRRRHHQRSVVGVRTSPQSRPASPRGLKAGQQARNSREVDAQSGVRDERVRRKPQVREARWHDAPWRRAGPEAQERAHWGARKTQAKALRRRQCGAERVEGVEGAPGGPLRRRWGTHAVLGRRLEGETTHFWRIEGLSPAVGGAQRSEARQGQELISSGGCAASMRLLRRRS